MLSSQRDMVLVTRPLVAWPALLPQRFLGQPLMGWPAKFTLWCASPSCCNPLGQDNPNPPAIGGWN